MGAIDRVFRSRRPSQERPLAAIIAGLWRNGEQGVRYEAGDLATMFQDAAGTLPVYAPGSGQVDPPVGLWLDKRLGLLKGPERLTASWATDAGISYAGSALTFAAAPSSSYATNTGTVAAGKWYEATFTVTGFSGSGGVSWAFNTVSTGNVITANGTYTQLLLAANSGPAAVRARLAATTAVVSNISLKELPGNHAYQTTTTSRPALSARYNALSASERFDDAYWGFTSNYAVEKTGDVQDPSGGSNAWKITSTTGSAALDKVVGAGFKNPVYTVILRAGSRNPDILIRNATTTTNLVGGSTSSPSTSGTYGKFTNADLGGGWRKLTIEITSGVATSDVLIVYLGSTGSVATGQYFYAYRAEFREGNDGVGLPEYQRVVDPNTYDTTGFPLYLRFDGVDDWMQTAAVDFSGTDKLFATAALRKLSDSAAGIVAELSGVSNTNNGSFALLAPAGPGDTFAVYMRGATALTTIVPSGVPSPASRVFTGVMDTSAAVGRQSRSRLNGAHYAYASQDSGGGNFGSYPLYIGRRGGTGIPFNGRLYSLLIRGAATPDTTIAKVERHLNQKARIY